MYEWLTSELASIKARRFHLFQPVARDALEYRERDVTLPLPPSFSAFLQQFGRAALYTDSRDIPKVAVYPLEPHRRATLTTGETLIEFGFYKEQSAYFQRERLGTSEAGVVFGLEQRKLIKEGARFEEHLWSGKPRRLAGEFTEWLRAMCGRARSEYSKAAWQRVTDGPRPFTAKEAAIVEARRQFKWRVVDHTAQGNLLFEVTNGSSLVLPFLSLGARGTGGNKLDGGVWLRTAAIQPGQTVVVEQSVYRDQLAPNEVEMFDLPDPIPEKKERYWEFKALGAPRAGKRSAKATR